MSINYSDDLITPLFASNIASDLNYQSLFASPTAGQQRILMFIEIVRSYLAVIDDVAEAKTFQRVLTKAMMSLKFGSSAFDGADDSVEMQARALHYLTNHPGVAVSLSTDEPGPSPFIYKGPLDIVSGAVLAYSQRALSVAWIGQNLIKLRRDSDDTTMIFIAGADGGVDVTAVTTWLAGANGFVDTLYDQSGNGVDISNTNLAQQPSWAASVQAGKPGMIFADNSHVLHKITETIFINTGMVSFFAISKNFDCFCSQGLLDNYIDISTGSDPVNHFAYVDMYDGTNEAGHNYDNNLSLAAFSVWDGTSQFGATSYDRNGISLPQTRNFDSGGPLVPATVGVIQFGTNAPAESGICEFILYTSIISDDERLNVRQNIAAYYGISLA